MVIYADVIFFVNFISTLSLILAYTIMFSCKRHIVRAVAASAVSGAYAVTEAVTGTPYILRLAVLFVICIIAYGRYSVLYNTARFVFVSVCVQVVFMVLMAVMGNDAYVANGSVAVFTGDIPGFVVYLLTFPVVMSVRRIIKLRLQLRHCRFIYHGQCKNVTLLYDSGNRLMHNEKPIAVVSWNAVREVMGVDTYEEFITTAEEQMAFNTVGGGGTLFVTAPDKTFIDGRQTDIKLAVVDKEFKGYDGIIGI